MKLGFWVCFEAILELYDFEMNRTYRFFLVATNHNEDELIRISDKNSFFHAIKNVTNMTLKTRPRLHKIDTWCYFDRVVKAVSILYFLLFLTLVSPICHTRSTTQLYLNHRLTFNLRCLSIFSAEYMWRTHKKECESMHNGDNASKTVWR